MKIALDVSQMVYQGTGVGNYTKNLVSHLLQLNSDNQFVLYAGVFRKHKDLLKLKKSSPWNKATWKLLPLPPRLAAKIFASKKIDIKSFIGDADVFHASDWTHPNTSIPTVTTVHDLVFKKYPETLAPHVLTAQKNRFARLTHHSSHIIVDSKSTKKDLEKLYDIDPKRVTTIYLGVDSIYSPQKRKEIERVKKKYSINSKYIMTLGTIEPRKNLQKTIESFVSLKQDDKYSNYKLLIVGKHGWGDPLVTRRSDIIETGFVDSQDLPALLSGAETFLYPSLYEGFGLPVLEAMSCGAPVVTSNISSLPEVAGKAGILIDPEDVFSIVTGIKKAITRKNTLSEASTRQASKFSWAATAEKTLEVYEKVYKADLK